MIASRRSHRRQMVLAVVATAALTLSLVTASSASANAGPTPVRNHEAPVLGSSAPTVAKRRTPASSTSETPHATPLESSQSATLDTPVGGAPGQSLSDRHGTKLTVAGSWREIGTSGVSIAPLRHADDSTVKATAPESTVESVKAALLSADAARKYGLSGLVIRLLRTDGKTSTDPLAITIPTKTLDGLYGGDYASRIHWVQVTEPTDTTSTTAHTLRNESAVTSTPDATTSETVLTAQVPAQSILIAPLSAPIGAAGTGAYTASSLKSSSTWGVSAQTGTFSWTYPLRTPPAAAGPSPQLSFAYNSQGVDGETGSTNNQPSSVGEGWNLTGAGYIERSYTSCSTDTGASGPVTSSGDECWKVDNATMNLAGHAGQLVKVSGTQWRLQDDDGSRIDELVGTAAGCSANGTYDTDCWRLTTVDGTQYYFGKNELPGWTTGKPVTNSTWTVPVYGNDTGEPCHAATFAASSCTQAWRWNLDYVVDVHGNSEALYYNAQTNMYSANGTTATTYTRGGEVEHIDYGIVGNLPYATNAASDKVVFGYAATGRCSDATGTNCTAEGASGLIGSPANPTYYPDVPFDQNCTSGACTGNVSPTFYSTSMLATVTTQVLSSGAYSNVDQWAVSHSFPAPGDGTSPALWMTQLVHTGLVGASTSEPATVFSGIPMQNRVWAVDGLVPLDKYRLSSIQTETGGLISVNYSAQQCTPANAAAIMASPQTNTQRCFPQWWSPQVVPPQAPQEDLFHKYVVTSLISNPVTGGGQDATQETDYVYPGTPAWRYDTNTFTPDRFRTWSVFAGYNSVEVRVGSPATPAAQQTTDYIFYQGMNGDRAAPTGGVKTVNVLGTSIPDSLWFAGQTYEQKVLNGVGGAAVSDTITTPTLIATTASDGTNSAWLTGQGDLKTIRTNSVGAAVTVETKTTFDTTYGLPQTIETDTPDAGNTCTTNTYAPPNTTVWIIGAIHEVQEVATTCALVSSAVYPAAAMADSQTYYDGTTSATSPLTAPTKGEITTTRVVDSYTGTTAGTAHWSTNSSTTYDSMGRPKIATDILGHTLTTSYVPATGGPLTGESAINTSGLAWTTSSVIDPAWGAVTSTTDENANVTSVGYDALGRRTAVWYANRPKATYPGNPSIAYSYVLSQTSPSVVETTTLKSANTIQSFSLYDGLGQRVQTQATGVAGTIMSDEQYDSLGQVTGTNNSYYTTQPAPATALFVPTSQSQIPSQTLSTFDAEGRPLASILMALGAERYRTSNVYDGFDKVSTTPPAGGTPTSAVTDSLGRTTSLTQYLSATTTGTAETTTYGHDPRGNMTSMTDPAGNAWSWAFNVMGQQVTAVDPDTGTTTSTYDLAGNLLTSTDNRGVVLAYSYDKLNRKTGQYLTSTGSSGSILAAWTYDTIAKGQLTSQTTYVGSTAGAPGAAYTESVLGYDSLYHPTSTKISIPTGAAGFGGTSYTTSYTYYQDGSLLTQVDPAEGGLAAETIKSTYGGFDNLTILRGTVTYAGVGYSGILQPDEYDRTGATTEVDSTYGYDQATGAVMGIGDQALTNGVYTTTANRVYTRNNAGSITSATNTSNTTTDTQCYNYDYLNNLTAAWTPTSNSCAAAPTATTIGGPAPYWDSYTVDPATGNRLTAVQNPIAAGGVANTDTYSYPAAHAAKPHAVTTVTHVQGASTTTSSYGYDANGETTTRPGQTLTYDKQGKLSTVAAGATTQTNIYDPAGGLLLQTDPTNGTTLYLGDTELHVAVGTTTASAVRTYSAGGVPVAERTTVAGVTGSTLFWLTTDIDGTVDTEINSSTAAVTRRYNHPYGATRGSAAPWSDTHGFLNATTSALTGIAIVGARAYDSALGRFLSVDSVLAPMNPLQNNGYSYAANSPISNADPSGNYYVGGTLGDCGSSGCSGTSTSASNKAPGKGPDIGTVAKKLWDQNWNAAGQFYSGLGESLYGIGKFFLWDANIGGATANLVNQIGCVSNYSACEAQREAAAAPWQADFWGTAKKTFVDPIWNDFRDHPAHAIGAIVPDLALFAVPGGGLIKGARVAEEAGAEVASVGALRAAGLQDAHHIIQDAAVRDLPGYATNSAPGVQLSGPSTLPGTEHYAATVVQRGAGGGTYGAERQIALNALKAAGYSDEAAASAVSQADRYFVDQLGVNMETPTRIPGNRAGQ